MDSHFNKKILITGINSFTGYHLKQELNKQGLCVFGTVQKHSSDANVFTCDLTNKQSLLNVIKQVQPDYVIHLAGVSFVGHPIQEDFYRINVIGTQNLLEALVEINFDGKGVKKVILASSATVYGNQNLEILDESLCPKPANHYGISKLSMEHVARTFFDKLPIIVTRPFNYIGVGQPKHFVIPKIVSHFKAGARTIELGNIDVEREFNDINYVCDIYIKLLESDFKSEFVNLCSGRGVKLLNVIKIMENISGYEIKIEVNPAFIRVNELPKLVGSTVKLESMVGVIKNINLFSSLNEIFLNQK